MNFAEEYQKFLRYLEVLSSSENAKVVEDYAIILNPNAEGQVDLALVGLIHGNEVIGISIFNQILEDFLTGKLSLEISLCLLLGNIPAAKQNKRFIDQDLNRSFETNNHETVEDCIAKRMEVILSQCRYVIDFHQTQSPTPTPFYIYELRSRQQYIFSKLSAPSVPLILFTETFSSNGKCQEDFVLNRGNIDVTIELGLKGFDPKQRDLGYEISLNAIKAVTTKLKENILFTPSQIYTWGFIGIFRRPFILQPGFKNWDVIYQKQSIGQLGNEDFKAPVEGRIVFPKYDASGLNGQENFRIIVPTTKFDRLLKLY
ncbi:MAG: hypothetical protein ACOCUH_01230 [Bacteriovoracia bacterium]